MTFEPLSNVQIDRYFEPYRKTRDKLFLGCYSKDELQALTAKAGFAVINMQNSDKGSGTHWVAFYLCRPIGIYYDSFGIVPPIAIKQYMQRVRKRNIFCDTDEQNIKSHLCGYFCVYVLRELISGRKIVDIIADDFVNNTQLNDAILESYFTKEEIQRLGN